MRADHSAPQSTAREFSRAPRGAGDAELQRHIRALVDGLMRELIGAVLAGSPAEFAELIEALGRRRSEAVASRGAFPSHRADARSRKRGRSATRATAERSAPEDHALELRPSHAANNPFDITSPGELLASTVATRTKSPTLAGDAAPSPASPPIASGASTANSPDALSRDGSGALSPSAPEAVERRDPHLLDPPSPRRQRTREPASAQLEADLEAESERRPKIVLREGERLLSATGSGVVIRRARLNTAR